MQKFKPQKRKTVVKSNPLQSSRVGVSNRPGLGYDASVFTKGALNIHPTSLPHGHASLPYVPKPKKDSKDEAAQLRYEKSLEVAEQERKEVQKSRKPDFASADLSSVSGLFIPGGQDRTYKGDTEEAPTRDKYEQALLKEAREIGMPTLAVCGGSRACAKAYGAGEEKLSKSMRRIHKQKTSSQAHGLKFPNLPSILGASSPTKGTLDKINSTHEKIADMSTVRQLPTASKKGDVPDKELQVTAKDEHDNPEGFETTHGAPVIGVTSHPEAIYRGSNDREAATDNAKTWSDNIFKAFHQSMQTYDRKKSLMAEIRSKSKPKGYDELGKSVDLQQLHNEGFMLNKLGKSKATRNRMERPQTYQKWRGKRNWQKLLKLRMITPEEAESIRQEAATARAQKKLWYQQGRPGHERPDPVG